MHIAKYVVTVLIYMHGHNLSETITANIMKAIMLTAYGLSSIAVRLKG